MSASTASTVFGIVVMLGAAAASLIAAVIQQRKLENPEDATVVELENLSAVCKLRGCDQYLL